MAEEQVLEVNDLKTHFFSREGTLRAVDGLEFDLNRSEVLGIAGESGCGKSVAAQSILRIVPANGKTISGEILLSLDDRKIDLLTLAEESKEIKDIRGKEISMIFQEPMTSFSTVHTIGNQIIETIMLHQDVTKKQAREQGIEMLRQVGMPNPSGTIDEYPFNLSGGMRQRAMIAMALSCNPRVLIADEPTTAVDVTIQAQVLELMKTIQGRLHMAIMIITHDLGIIAELADRILVMYMGKEVEFGLVDDVYYGPKHPYTQGLLASIPKLTRGRQTIEPIAGAVPNPYELPDGCKFHPRCPHVIAGKCDKEDPPTYTVGDKHTAACFLCER